MRYIKNARAIQRIDPKLRERQDGDVDVDLWVVMKRGARRFDRECRAMWCEKKIADVRHTHEL